MKKIESYQHSLINFIDMSSGDATSSIAREHGIMGFTRISICMQQLGLNPQENYFIALPDYTYTRNALRWNAGFPYGCIICINQAEPFIPIDFRPNCCGVILAEISETAFDIIKLKNEYYNIIQSYPEIDITDFNRRNHFFGIYCNSDTGKYYFMIHGSFMFAKKGLYNEMNEDLLSKRNTLNIFGIPFNYLQGYEAEQYYNNYKYYEERSNYYRELIMKSLFPNARILFHRTHEGFMNMGTILLGAYADLNPFNCPIMLAPEENLPYVNINNPVKLGTSYDLYCAPHGGGYALSAVESATKTEKIGNEFIITYSNNSKMLTNNIIDMPFYYRKDSADKWCNQYNKGKIIDVFNPIFNLKV